MELNENMLPDVWIMRDVSDAAAASAESEWAAGYLAGVLRSKELTVVQSERLGAGSGAKLIIVLTGREATAVRSAVEQQGIGLPEAAEAFAIIRVAGANELIAVGADVRGLVYAILEMADIVKHAVDPLEALASIRPFVEKPTNPVRSVTRLFSSEAEDKAWFYDEDFWEPYLTELVTHRFNRFTLGTGAGYDYLIDKIVEDTYFCFIYPYLLSVPGYRVHVDGLADTEREKPADAAVYWGTSKAAWTDIPVGPVEPRIRLRPGQYEHQV